MNDELEATRLLRVVEGGESGGGHDSRVMDRNEALVRRWTDRAAAAAVVGPAAPILEPATGLWLVPGFLPCATTVCLKGKPAAGKSWLALDAALSVAFGSAFLGQIEPGDRGNVVFFDDDGLRSCWLTRCRALMTMRGVSHPEGYHIFWRAIGDMSLDNGWCADMLTILEPVNPKLIILDARQAVLAWSAEAEASAVLHVSTAAEYVADQFGSTLLIITDHCNVDLISTLQKPSIELIWSVETSPGKLRHLRCEADRDGELEGASFSFTLDRKDGHPALQHQQSDIGGDLAASAILGLLEREGREGRDVGAGKIVDVVGVECGVGRTKVYETLKRLQLAGRIVSPEWGRWAVKS